MSRAQLSLKRLYAIAPVAGANVLISRMCSSVLLKTKLVCVQCACVSQASTVLFMSVTAAAMGSAFIGLFLDVFKPGTFLFFFACMLALLGCYTMYLIRRRTDLPPEMQEPFVSMTRTPREALKFYPRMDTQPQLSEALASHDSTDPDS